MAPLPKKKHTRARSGRRRGNIKLAKPTLTICAHCGAKKRPHMVCPKCGKK